MGLDQVLFEKYPDINRFIHLMHTLNIYRIKPKYQYGKSHFLKKVVKCFSLMRYLISILISFLAFYFLLATPSYAVVDPLDSPNNKFGIHIISATPDESSPAADLVNSSGGDWGYVTFLIESKDRDENKWQEFFNDLRRRKLIPIVRLATYPEGNYWKRPYDGEEEAWADFLDKLNWPVKNRYITIYNEPNHANEWGNEVDPKSYAKVLDKTITALKNKNRDFFVLNAGFDASTPHQPPRYMEQYTFMQQMSQEVPGIFERLDGWVSHSYPNPEFSSSPTLSGRGTVRTWMWEMEVLKELGVTKELPIFITETGWKHAEGLIQNNAYPSAEKVAEYFKYAYENVWNGSRIVAVTPFLLDYQEVPFDHFSFKKPSSYKNTLPIPFLQDLLKLTSYPDYYPQYQTIKDLPKTKGKPEQDHKTQLLSGEIFSSLVAGQDYTISLKFKNIGQSIWNDTDITKLVATQGGQNLAFNTQEIATDVKVEPGKEYTFTFPIHSPQEGKFKVVMNLFTGDKQFSSPPLEFETEVKSPVVLKIKSSLKWKNSAAGDYLLRIAGAIGESIQNITLAPQGESEEVEARYLLPDYTFDFTLSKHYYYPMTVRQTVRPGVNVLDFGELQPNFFSALPNFNQIWQISPFSK